MNTCIIRQMPDQGRDAKTFRAYGVGNRALCVSVSSTGHEHYAAMRCAAKAFQKFSAGQSDLDELKTRIVLTPKTTLTGEKRWEASLQPKGTPLNLKPRPAVACAAP